MQTLAILTQVLKKNKVRITTIRKALLMILLTRTKPMSVYDFQKRLQHEGIDAHKVTLYRDIELLCTLGIMREVSFTDGFRRYELEEDHHHHAVCTACKEVFEINDQALEKAVFSLERRTKKRYHFASLSHNLEFLGVCTRCFKHS
ncbi:hypothetical protein COU89_03210 [Candidatus Roizmanbacteria bacterium CG10_big_fil_rev_8_21_14_0_10_45_7]|uniref:Transcriptional repressor n=1 Tax=Candidatus Roizmanbacteria bacterium CG10_big_fil_rev_8_21_14_0_10_45_7 TaxID=1974854 RepID=A0A2M8KUA9_9BACT|nr:MAG: hypothetical protein COU89_03210 [Candidatus Roizmanbacteria bacterium CG10_big_fil_rev_8_21_14_0_10_45_7]